MATVRDNATRVKRFRELKATLRTDRSRLLVGLDIAQAEHVVHLRHAHTRVVVPSAHHPEHHPGLHAAVGADPAGPAGDRVPRGGLRPGAHRDLPPGGGHVPGGPGRGRRPPLQQRGLLEPADPGWDLGQARPEGRGQLRRPPGAGQGPLLLASPTGPLAELRHLVRCLRRARGELAACKARWRTTLRPALAPMGEPLPSRLWAELPAVLQAWEPVAPGRPAVPKGRLPLGLATACADLGAQVTAVQARIAALEAACTPLAERLPGLRAPPDDPGDRAHGGRDPPGGDRRHRLVHAVLPAPEARGPRHRPGAVGPVRGAGADLEVRPRAPALGALPRGDGDGADHGGAGPPRGPEGQAAGRSVRRLQGDRRVGGEGAPGRVGGLAERDPVRSHAGRAGSGASRAEAAPGAQQSSSPGSWQRDTTTWRRPRATAGGHWRAAPTLESPD